MFKKWLRDQTYFVVLKLFNSALNFIPFNIWKRFISFFLGFRIATGSSIHSGLKIFGFKRVQIGNNSVINSGCYIDNRRSIIIGSNVSIAHDVRIYTLGHDVDSQDYCLKGASVMIKDYACIFTNAMIMPGLIIGEGAVIYPGSVVTKDVADYDVVGGNPAKVLRKRNNNLNYKLDHSYWFSI